MMEGGFDEAERGGAGPECLVGSVCSRVDEGGVSQVGICADCGSGVGGDGHCGDDADVARRCKVDEVANVGVRVEALGRVGRREAPCTFPVGGAFGVVPVAGLSGDVAADCGQHGVSGHAHAPPGVVGEVPVQDVEAVAGHDGQE